MTLLDLHVELAVTNALLKRIADALDRAIPITDQPDHSAHPLIGLADISRLSPERLAKQDAERATLPFRASARVFSKASRDEGGGVETPQSATNPAASISSIGQWDHDDPLDTLDDLEWPPNYAGVDR
jgi:hypothetical protein